MKDLKYILKRIIIGVGIALALMYLKGNFLLVTNAQVLIDNNQLSYNNYLVLQPGSSQFHFYDNTVYQDISIFPQYFLLTMCTDSNNINSWSIANSSLTNVNFYNTSISCTFPNSTYTGGHITYIYGQVDPSASCSVNLTNCYQIGYINFTVPNRSSWALLSYQLSKDVINIDYGSNTIINQNQMILSGQQSIINNQNQNATDIINNQNQNATDIINNQNNIANEQAENQKVCKFYSSSDIKENNKYLNSDGSLSSNNNYGVSDYLNIDNSELYIITRFNNSSRYYCFYSQDKTLISCNASNTQQNDSLLTVPDNSYFVRFTFYKSSNVPRFKICKNGNQSISDSLNDDNVDSATNNASSFFDDFTVNSHGLSGIITSPLRLINSLSTSSCSPLSLPLPFVNQSVILPCMSTIYSQHFSTFLTLYRLITDGIISYWVLIKIFGHIKGMQSPEDDRIEVLDL